jgi:amino acid permease
MHPIHERFPLPSSPGYLITISDSMVNVLHHMIMTGDPERDDRFLISLLLSRHFWVVGAMASVLPFCFYRTLDELKRLSALALVFVFMLVGMIIAYAHGIADPCMGNVGGEVGTCKGDIVPFTNIPSTLTRVR